MWNNGKAHFPQAVNSTELKRHIRNKYAELERCRTSFSFTYALILFLEYYLQTRDERFCGQFKRRVRLDRKINFSQASAF